jgi:hypothetical protein
MMILLLLAILAVLLVGPEEFLALLAVIVVGYILIWIGIGALLLWSAGQGATPQAHQPYSDFAQGCMLAIYILGLVGLNLFGSRTRTKSILFSLAFLLIITALILGAATHYLSGQALTIAQGCTIAVFALGLIALHVKYGRRIENGGRAADESPGKSPVRKRREKPLC